MPDLCAVGKGESAVVIQGAAKGTCMQQLLGYGEQLRGDLVSLAG